MTFCDSSILSFKVGWEEVKLEKLHPTLMNKRARLTVTNFFTIIVLLEPFVFGWYYGYFEFFKDDF